MEEIHLGADRKIEQWPFSSPATQPVQGTSLLQTSFFHPPAISFRHTETVWKSAELEEVPSVSILAKAAP